MKNLIIGSIIVMVMVMASLIGCATVPYGGYDGYNSGYYGSWGPRWVPGYQRWVCEGPPPNTRCYWTWEPAHYE